eukprot:635739-Amphidinium_carterae.1
MTWRLIALCRAVSAHRRLELSWHDMAVLSMREMMALIHHVPGQLLEVQEAVHILTRCFASVQATQSSTGEVPIQPGDILCVRSAAYFVLEVQPASIIVADPHRPLLLAYQHIELPWGLTTVLRMSKGALLPAMDFPQLPSAEFVLLQDEHIVSIEPLSDSPQLQSPEHVLLRDEHIVTIEPLLCELDVEHPHHTDEEPHLAESLVTTTGHSLQVRPQMVSQFTQTEAPGVLDM